MTTDDSGPSTYYFMGRPIDNAGIRDQAVEWLLGHKRAMGPGGPIADIVEDINKLKAMTFPLPNPNEGMLL